MDCANTFGTGIFLVQDSFVKQGICLDEEIELNVLLVSALVVVRG